MTRNCATCDEEIETIVDIVQHDCKHILRQEDLTPNEKSTLLYIESCLVDRSGNLDPRRMNHEDQHNIKVFKAEGLMEIEEFQAESFTDRAWELAWECRRERAER